MISKLPHIILIFRIYVYLFIQTTTNSWKDMMWLTAPTSWSFHVLWPSLSCPLRDLLPFASCESPQPVTCSETLSHHQVCSWALSVPGFWVSPSWLVLPHTKPHGDTLSPELSPVQVICDLDLGCMGLDWAPSTHFAQTARKLPKQCLSNLGDRQHAFSGELEFRILKNPPESSLKFNSHAERETEKETQTEAETQKGERHGERHTERQTERGSDLVTHKALQCRHAQYSPAVGICRRERGRHL